MNIQPSTQPRSHLASKQNGRIVHAVMPVNMAVSRIGGIYGAATRKRQPLALSGSAKASREMRYCPANATCLGAGTRNNNTRLDQCRTIGSFGTGWGQYVQGPAQLGNLILAGIWGKRSYPGFYFNALPHQSSSSYGMELRRATARRHTLHKRHRNPRRDAAFNGSWSGKCQTGKRCNHPQNGKKLTDRLDMVSCHTAHSHSIRTSPGSRYSLPLALPFVGIRPPKTLLLGVCGGGGGLGFESPDKVFLLESFDNPRMEKKGGLGNQLSHMGGAA